MEIENKSNKTNKTNKTNSIKEEFLILKSNVEKSIDDNKLIIEAEKIKLEGNEMFKNKKYNEALELYIKAFELNPKELTYNLNLASCYHQLKDYHNVIDNCSHVITASNDKEKQAKAYGRMAYAYQELKDYTKAIEAFKSSISIKSNNNLVISLSQVIKLKEQFDKENYINKELAEEHNKKADVLFKKGDFPQSIVEYSKAIERFPTNADYYINRGLAKIKLIDHNGSIIDFKEALKYNPHNLFVIKKLASIYEFLTYYLKAYNLYQKGLEKNPDDKDIIEGVLNSQIGCLVNGDKLLYKEIIKNERVRELFKNKNVCQIVVDSRISMVKVQQTIMQCQDLNEAYNILYEMGIIEH